MSDSPSSSRSSSPPLALDPSTLAILNGFLNDKAAEERRFKELQEKAEADAASGEGEKMMDVDTFRATIGENFGMSQFWYSTSFATSLSQALDSLLPPDARVAFISSPTAYVSFQNLCPRKGALLFEYDERFGALPVVGRTSKPSGPGEKSRLLEEGGFVKYDLYEPERFPEELKGTVDLVVVDPPYLNEKTNALVSRTLAQLLNPSGSARMLLLTSSSVPLEALHRAYAPTVPLFGGEPLRRCEGAKVEHDGGRIQNPFAMYASWKGGEAFMDVSGDGKA